MTLALRKAEVVQVFTIPSPADTGDKLAIGANTSEVVKADKYPAQFEDIPVTAWTPAAEYISSGTTAVTSAKKPVMLGAGNWEGDCWVEDDYRVERKFVTKYPHLYGPAAIDPDKGSGDIECNDALTKWIAGIIKKITGIEETGGLYSTWSERHCAETALYIGYLYVESTADIPPCPRFWLSEAQYWYPHIIIGRQLKKLNLFEYLKNPKVWALLGGAVTAGYAFLPQILKAFGG